MRSTQRPDGDAQIRGPPEHRQSIDKLLLVTKLRRACNQILHGSRFHLSKRKTFGEQTEDPKKDKRALRSWLLKSVHQLDTLLEQEREAIIAKETGVVLLVLKEIILWIKDRAQKYLRTSNLFRWLRFNLKRQLRAKVRQLEEVTDDLKHAVRNEQKFSSIPQNLSSLPKGSPRKFWEAICSGTELVSEIPMQKFVDFYLHFINHRVSKDGKTAQKLRNFVDPNGTGRISIVRFATILEQQNFYDLADCENTSTFSLLLRKLLQKVSKTHSIESKIPVAMQVEGNGFHELKGGSGNISDLFKLKKHGEIEDTTPDCRIPSGPNRSEGQKPNGKVFEFTFTENAKGYGDDEPVEKKVGASINLQKGKHVSPVFQAQFSEKPLIKWGINFAGTVSVSLDHKDGNFTQKFKIFLPGLKTYDPAGRTGDPHASEAIGASCTRFQGFISSSQIFSAIHGGGSKAIQIIQERARPILERYHGRNALYEWMQHQVQSVFVDFEEPMEYPTFIQTYFVETGVIDLENPAQKHTASYLQSFFSGTPYPPPEYFEKLAKKYNKTGQQVTLCGKVLTEKKESTKTDVNAKVSNIIEGSGESKTIDKGNANGNSKEDKKEHAHPAKSPIQVYHYSGFDILEGIGGIPQHQATGYCEILDDTQIERELNKPSSTLTALGKFRRAVEKVKTLSKVTKTVKKNAEDAVRDKLLSINHIDFQSKMKLGEGNFGCAWLCMWKNAFVSDNGEQNVVVKIPHHRGINESDWKELNAWLKLKEHPHVLNLEGVLYDSVAEKLCLAMQYCEKGSLDKLHGVMSLTDPHISVRIALQLASAVDHLHNGTPCILHGDIRCANILLDGNFNVLLADWGLAKLLNCPQGTYRMTCGCHMPWPWSAPEVILDEIYHQKADVYMYGVAMWELLSQGQAPFNFPELDYNLSIKGFAKKVRKRELELKFPEKIPKELAKILEKCISPFPNERPTASQLKDLVSSTSNLISQRRRKISWIDQTRKRSSEVFKARGNMDEKNENRPRAHIPKNEAKNLLQEKLNVSNFCLWHMPRARSSRPLWLYYELKSAYGNVIPKMEVKTFKSWSSFRNNKPDWFLKLNPNGKVPTMVHGNSTLWESVAICRYLLQTFDVKKLFTPATKCGSLTAKFENLSMYASTTIDNLTATSSPIQRMVANRSPLFKENLAVNRKAFVEIVGPILENALGSNYFFLGNNFSALDVILGYNLMVLDAKVGWLDSELFPKLHFYYHERLVPRPAFKKVFAENPRSLFSNDE